VVHLTGAGGYNAVEIGTNRKSSNAETRRGDGYHDTRPTRKIGLAEREGQEHDSGMKNPRDILVAGIGFVVGMVVCYFVSAPKSSQRERGWVTFVYGSSSSAPTATNGIDLKALELNWN